MQLIMYYEIFGGIHKDKLHYTRKYNLRYLLKKIMNFICNKDFYLKLLVSPIWTIMHFCNSAPAFIPTHLQHTSSSGFKI